MSRGYGLIQPVERVGCVVCAGSLPREDAIAAEKALYPVRLLCELLEVSRSGFYAWVDRPDAAQDDCGCAAGRGDPRSARAWPWRVWQPARAPSSCDARGHPRRQEAHRAVDARKRHRGPEKAPFRAHDRLAARAPDRAQPARPRLRRRRRPTRRGSGDVTYIATGEGWLYLAVLLDLFSRRVVGWATSAVNDARARSQSPRPRPTCAHAPRPAWCTTPTAAARTPATNTGRRCVDLRR